MSKFIIEEVEQTNLTEAELAEFTEIPIVNADDEDDICGFGSDDDSIADSNYQASSDYDEGNASKKVKCKPSTSSDKKKSRSKRPSKRKTLAPASPEPVQSTFLKKFMSGEISYSDYAKRMGDMTFDEIQDDDASGDESDNSTSTIKKMKKRSKKQAEKAETHHAKKSKRALPLALQGVMGQANLCFARGDVSLAEKLCLEIIRQEPMAAEPC